MTATEVLERGAQAARLLGATYGRLQTELLTPLVTRCLAILRRRGEIPPLLLDGRDVALRYESPLARLQGRADAANTLLFLQARRRARRRRRGAGRCRRGDALAGEDARRAGRGACSPPTPSGSDPHARGPAAADRRGATDAGGAREIPRRDRRGARRRAAEILPGTRAPHVPAQCPPGPPAPDAAPEDLARFRQAMGIPEAPEGYAIAAPHDLCCADDEINGRLHAAHFSNDQAQLVYDLAAERPAAADRRGRGAVRGRPPARHADPALWRGGRLPPHGGAARRPGARRSCRRRSMPRCPPPPRA